MPKLDLVSSAPFCKLYKFTRTLQNRLWDPSSSNFEI
jgi:hypothetical protein